MSACHSRESMCVFRCVLCLPFISLFFVFCLFLFLISIRYHFQQVIDCFINTNVDCTRVYRFKTLKYAHKPVRIDDMPSTWEMLMPNNIRRALTNLTKTKTFSILQFYFVFFWFPFFLAHLSTKWSGWAIVTGLCPSSCVVRRASSVVRRP